MNATKEMIYEDETGCIRIDEFDQFSVQIKDGEYTSGYMPVDVRKMTCCICGEGWELKPKAIMNQYECRSARSMVHKTCYERWLTFEQRMLFIKAVQLSKFRMLRDGVKPIKNQYGGAWNTDWFEFRFDQLDHITLTIGRRKRVYEILMKSTQPLDSKRFKRKFETENVTKRFEPDLVLLHAWDDQKLMEYVNILSLQFDDLEEKTSGFVAGSTKTVRLG